MSLEPTKAVWQRAQIRDGAPRLRSACTRMRVTKLSATTLRALQRPCKAVICTALQPSQMTQRDASDLHRYNEFVFGDDTRWHKFPDLRRSPRDWLARNCALGLTQPRHQHVLHMYILFDAVIAAFPSIARLFDPAKRHGSSSH
jgi:hypothetical protein